MSMLQYRHKSRAWKAMAATDEEGSTRPVKDVIARALEDGDTPEPEPVSEMDDLA